MRLAISAAGFRRIESATQVMSGLGLIALLASSREFANAAAVPDEARPGHPCRTNG
jgi:hypothetical protein